MNKALEAFNNGFQTEQNGETYYTFPHEATVLIRTALTSQAWQGIDSIPRDGTKVLLYMPNAVRLKVMQGWCNAHGTIWREWELNADNSGSSSDGNEATHWKPLDLPNPPQEKE